MKQFAVIILLCILSTGSLYSQNESGRNACMIFPHGMMGIAGFHYPENLIWN